MTEKFDVNVAADKHYQAQILKLEAERDLAQQEVHRLNSLLTIQRGQIAGYKLAARTLGRISRKFVEFTAVCAENAYRFRLIKGVN